MPLRSQGGPTGTVVADDGSIDIPGIPADETGRRPCRLQAFLRGVYYDPGGDDIGSRWSFRVTVNSGVWLSGTRFLQHGQWNAIEAKVHDEVRPGGCGSSTLVAVCIAAHELSGPLLDHVGRHLEVTAVSCQPEEERVRLILFVLVPERGWRRVWHRLQRKFERVARLVFILEIETRCQG